MKHLIFTLLCAAAFGLFAHTIRRYVRVMLMGSKDPRPRWDEIPKRVARVIIYFLGQKKVAERQLGQVPSSRHHLWIFWGFLMITVGTTELLFVGMIPGFSFRLFLGEALHGLLWGVIDVFNFIVLAMMGFAFFRRLVLKPRLIPMSVDAGLILGAISGLMISHFFFHGFHAVAQGHASVRFAPFSSVLAGAFQSVEPGTAGLVSEVAFWIHMIIVLCFMNYLPFSKHIHLLGALPNIATMNLSERKMDLPKVNLEDETQWGVGTFEQFSWKSLLDTYACTECARCSNYCPAFATDKPLSPMDLIHDIRYEMLERGSLKLTIQDLEKSLANHAPSVEGNDNSNLVKLPEIEALEKKLVALRAKLDEMPPMVGGRIKEETLWSCTTCGACQEACPVFIEHPLKIIQMRQNLVLAQEKVPADLARAFRNIERNSNPWGIGADRRMEWAEGLDVPTIEDKPNPEYLLWVGCAGAFDQRIRKQTQAMVKILNAAGVDYAVLGPEEQCTGDPARRGGNEMLFQMQAEANVETLNSKGIRKIITSCPHCLQTLRHDYPQFGGHYQVVHHTQLISHLVETGKLKPEQGGTSQKVVFHDSCYLGRWNGEYEAPRKVLKSLPIVQSLVEPERTRAKGFCCGAGGGRMFMEEHGPRVNRNRTEELVKTGADTIAVACPFCNVMMSDGVKDMNKEDDVKILDVAELVARSIPEAPARADESSGSGAAG
ncbi:MAG: (Fe-S)-binding protein [Deltaproteobacteria bacterium]|nr:(Fe-S)-binding protein [Deltaproteobacteria bacterium]